MFHPELDSAIFDLNVDVNLVNNVDQETRYNTISAILHDYEVTQLRIAFLHALNDRVPAERQEERTEKSFELELELLSEVGWFAALKQSAITDKRIVELCNSPRFLEAFLERNNPRQSETLDLAADSVGISFDLNFVNESFLSAAAQDLDSPESTVIDVVHGRVAFLAKANGIAHSRRLRGKSFDESDVAQEATLLAEMNEASWREKLENASLFCFRAFHVLRRRLDHVRRNGADKFLTMGSLVQDDGQKIDVTDRGEANPSELIHLKYVLAQLESAVNELSDYDAALLFLRFNQNMTFDDIAERLNFDDRTVAYRRLVKVLKSLKEKLSGKLTNVSDLI